MSHSITSRRRDDAPAAAREADRVAAGAQARAQRPPHVDLAAVAPPLVAARAPQRGGELAGASSAGRAARARAASSASKRLAASSSSSLAIASGTSTSAPSSSSSPRAPARRRDARGARAARRARSCSDAGRVVGRRGGGLRVGGVELVLGRGRAAEDREEHRVERLGVRLVGDEHRRGRSSTGAAAVIGRTSVSARAKSAGRSGVIGTPASCRRRLSAAASGGRSSSIVSTPEVSHRCARAARGRPRGSPPGPRRT